MKKVFHTITAVFVTVVLLLGTMAVLPPKPANAMSGSSTPIATNIVSDIIDQPILHEAIFRPEEHPELTTVDGRTYRYNTWDGPLPPDETWWTLLRNGPGTNAEDSSQSYGIGITASRVYDNWWGLSRIITLFDTSLIPPDAEITEATFSCVVLSKREIDEWADFSLVVVSSCPESNTAIVPDDYQCLGSTALSNIIPVSSIPEPDSLKVMITFTLNDQGLQFVTKGGITKLGIREYAYDCQNSAPPWAYIGASASVSIAPAEHIAKAPPTLHVTWVTYEPTPGPFAIITKPASNITATTANLNGYLSSLGTAASASVSFEYGTSTSYGMTTTAQTRTTKGYYYTAITGLSPNTTYHFRAKAVGDGTGYGSDVAFTTLPTTESLLQKYAPVLYLHPDEDFPLRDIYSMLNQSHLRNDGETIGGPISTDDLASHDEEDYYLDMVGASSDSAGIPDPQRFEIYPHVVYGREYVGEYEGEEYIALQYWFFYPYNNAAVANWFDDYHEGDWEMITIVLDKETEAPILLSCAQHIGGTRYNWNKVVKIDKTHPRIFVALGSHANYATLDAKMAYWFKDVVSVNGTVLYPDDEFQGPER